MSSKVNGPGDGRVGGNGGQRDIGGLIVRLVDG